MTRKELFEEYGLITTIHLDDEDLSKEEESRLRQNLEHVVTYFAELGGKA